MTSDDPLLGYACTWWTPRAATWSYTSASLRSALAAHARIVDIETQRSLPARAIEAAVGKLVGRPWQYSHLERALVDRAARAGVERCAPAAVIEVADVDTPTRVPNFPYQDMSMAAALASRHIGGEHVNILPASEKRLNQLAERGTQRLQVATGVFAMSDWLADQMSEAGVPRERIRVVHAGINSVPADVRPVLTPVSGRLLFVGVDFVRKGGDAVLRACELLRARGVDVTLTVAGPPTWPAPGEPPKWVDFLGSVPPARIGAIMSEHDVFAMPSRFEAYGIAFVEALAAGLPCVAHDAYAMPELVRHGDTGVLVTKVEPEEIADAIERVLADPGFFTRVAAARTHVLDQHDWNRVAQQMVAFVREHIV